MKKYVLALCLTSTSVVWGACERTDIEFYLNKGFTPDQITALCSPKDATNETPQLEATPEQKVISQTKVDDIVERLKESLRVSDITVKNNQFMFTHTPKIEYGRPMIGGDYRTIEPSIDVSIPMDTLRVLTSNEGIPMIRSPYIKLGGAISRTVQNLDEYKDQKRKALDKYLSKQSDNKIRLKFKSGASVDDTTTSLKDLIDMYR